MCLNVFLLTWRHTSDGVSGVMFNAHLCGRSSGARMSFKLPNADGLLCFGRTNGGSFPQCTDVDSEALMTMLNYLCAVKFTPLCATTFAFVLVYQNENKKVVMPGTLQDLTIFNSPVSHCGRHRWSSRVCCSNFTKFLHFHWSETNCQVFQFLAKDKNATSTFLKNTLQFKCAQS